MILLLCGFFPKDRYSEVIRNSKEQVQFSANTFQERLIKGIKNNTNKRFAVLSAPFIHSFPNAYKKIYQESFPADDCINYVGFNNFFGIRNISRYLNLKKSFNYDYDGEVLDIIVYSTHTPLLKYAVYLKKKYNNVRISLLIPDLPNFMDLSNRKRVIYHFLKKIDIKNFYSLVNYVDKFILLTEQMNSVVNKNGKPYMVVEGILDTSNFKNKYVFSKKKIVAYTGTLNEKYGVKNLVDAFMLIDDSNLSLCICGKGDSERYIIEKAKIDRRIKYLGILSSENSFKLQCLSSVLVNPRQNNEEFTKYSFPSKNLEYLSTYKPVVAYMLDGIPKEYNNFFFVPKNDSVKELSKSILDALTMDEDNLVKYQDNVQSLLNKKDYIHVTMDILDFIKIN